MDDTVLTGLTDTAAGPGLAKAPTEREAHLAVVQGQLAAERAEFDRIELRERDRAGGVTADRLAMAARRWADAAPGDGGQR